MAPKVLPKAKAKAKAKAKGKAAPALAIVAAAGGGAPAVALPAVTAVALSADMTDIQMNIIDATGNHIFSTDTDAVAAIWGVPAVSFSHHDVVIRQAPPGKGVGKGMGPWAPANGWEIRLSSDIDHGAAGPMMAPPNNVEVRITQNGVQMLMS